MSDSTATEPEIRKGLAGVVVDYTAVSKVNPDTNSLLYRGYPVQELAATQPFEAVAYLLWHDELPTEAQLAELRAEERKHRALPENVKAAIDLLPLEAHPMDEVRTAVSVIGASDTASSGSVLDASGSPEENLARSVRLYAALPAIVAYGQRRRRGQELVEPRDDLDYSANFLWMTFGEEPAEVVVDAFNRSMILYAEHSFNASTFTARVITSTLSDLYSAIVGAIGALKGPLHGGANEAVMAMLEEIGSIGNVESYINDKLSRKEKIMGFGHRVYKNGDPRAKHLQKMSQELGKITGNMQWYNMSIKIEELVTGQKGLKPNVDFYSASVYTALQIPRDLFTPIFAVSRVSGWTAHILEQYEDNRLIRPRAEYVGPASQTFVPLNER